MMKCLVGVGCNILNFDGVEGVYTQRKSVAEKLAKPMLMDYESLNSFQRVCECCDSIQRIYAEYTCMKKSTWSALPKRCVAISEASTGFEHLSCPLVMRVFTRPSYYGNAAHRITEQGQSKIQGEGNVRTELRIVRQCKGRVGVK